MIHAHRIASGTRQAGLVRWRVPAVAPPRLSGKAAHRLTQVRQGGCSLRRQAHALAPRPARKVFSTLARTTKPSTRFTSPSWKTQPELIFSEFPRHRGHTLTVGALVLANLAVFATWRLAERTNDHRLRSLMEATFVQHRHSLTSGHFWAVILPSFSHVEWNHLFSNMVILVYLGKRMHQLLGARKFLGVYLAAAIAGSVATHIGMATGVGLPSPKDHVGMRYRNLLRGVPWDESASIGASDACMGLIGFWYMAFPRHKIHVFRKLSILEGLLKPDGVLFKAGSPGTVRRMTLNLLRRFTQFRFSVLWMLPLFFVPDLTSMASQLHETPVSVKPAGPRDPVNHAAHFGGLLTGMASYFVVGRPLKAKFAPGLLIERDPRRIYLMVVTASIWAGLYYLKIRDTDRKARQAVEQLPARLFIRPKTSESLTTAGLQLRLRSEAYADLQRAHLNSPPFVSIPKPPELTENQRARVAAAEPAFDFDRSVRLLQEAAECTEATAKAAVIESLSPVGSEPANKPASSRRSRRQRRAAARAARIHGKQQRVEGVTSDASRCDGALEVFRQDLDATVQNPRLRQALESRLLAGTVTRKLNTDEVVEVLERHDWRTHAIAAETVEAHRKASDAANKKKKLKDMVDLGFDSEPADSSNDGGGSDFKL